MSEFIKSFTFVSPTDPNMKLRVHESVVPNTVLITTGADPIGVLLSREQWEALVGLGSYSAYGDNIRFASEEEI